VPNRQLTTVAPPAAENPRPRKPIWSVPDSLPFTIPESDTPSDGLISYDPLEPGNRIVLPISCFLHAVIDLISAEKDWEILSYVLCHLPTLLANKHFFCGPKTSAAIGKLLIMLCSKISQGDLASGVVNWPTGLKPRDAQGLACHTLAVLISYRKCFDSAKQHVLVEVLMAGLSGQPTTIKACLQALSLSAFELPNSTRRFLPNILTKLSQIMTNASMAMHIIDFLAIVGSLPHLYANFTEADFKLVFGVALQYLRLHNRPEASPDTSWALSQHLRVMSYYIVYLWFLAVKLQDRPKHVKYITRQLLLANGDQNDVDEPAEVCFDWLARYTYASADPRPTNSMLSDIVMNPVAHRTPAETITEKTWVVGNALVTIRALSKIGWVEVTARRASGLTRILARIENVPMVGPGEVDPDMLSVPAMLSMDHESLGEDDELYQVRFFSPHHPSPPPFIRFEAFFVWLWFPTHFVKYRISSGLCTQVQRKNLLGQIRSRVTFGNVQRPLRGARKSPSIHRSLPCSYHSMGVMLARREAKWWIRPVSLLFSARSIECPSSTRTKSGSCTSPPVRRTRGRSWETTTARQPTRVSSKESVG
jgi:tuberous sclerosis 2